VKKQDYCLFRNVGTGVTFVGKVYASNISCGDAVAFLGILPLIEAKPL
jgi:hypothetical protein